MFQALLLVPKWHFMGMLESTIDFGFLGWSPSACLLEELLLSMLIIKSFLLLNQAMLASSCKRNLSTASLASRTADSSIIGANSIYRTSFDVVHYILGLRLHPNLLIISLTRALTCWCCWCHLCWIGAGSVKDRLNVGENERAHVVRLHQSASFRCAPQTKKSMWFRATENERRTVNNRCCSFSK
jgi:hypothetical protein